MNALAHDPIPLHVPDVDAMEPQRDDHRAEPIQPELRDSVERLRRRRAEIQRQLAELEPDQEGTHTSWSNHMAEDAQAQQDQHNLAAVRGVLQAEQRQVEHALERADKGLYGICEDCGQPIVPRRLVIVPATVLCVACQARRESPAGRAH